MKQIVATLAVACAAAGLHGQPTASPEEPTPVAIILTRDYPAFQPDTAGDGRRPLSALVLLGTIGESRTRTILLNPQYADERVLYEAISIIRRSPRPPSGNPGVVALDLRPPVRLPGDQITARLRRIIESLRSDGAAESRWQMASGTIVELPDIAVFFHETR